MGFTHYYTRPIRKNHDDAKWTEFISNCIDVLHKLPEDIELGNGEGTTHDPIFDNTNVCFNGMDEEAHETFQITKVVPKQPDYRKGETEIFEFCKTARKPYDLMVCACLLLYKFHFWYVKVSSDGDIDDWKEAIALVVDSCPKTKTDLTTLLLENNLEWLGK